MLTLILITAAFVLLVLAAVGVQPPRVHLGWLGLAVLVFVVYLLPALGVR